MRKDKYDTSTLFPDGTPKTDKESLLMGILNQMGGAIFKIKEGLSENKKDLSILTNKLEELTRLIRSMK